MKLLLHTTAVILLLLAIPVGLPAQQCPYQRALYQQYQQNTYTQLNFVQRQPQVNLQTHYQQQWNPGVASRTTYVPHTNNVYQQVHTPGTWNVNTSLSLQQHTTRETTHYPVTHYSFSTTNTALTTHHLLTTHNYETSYARTTVYNTHGYDYGLLTHTPGVGLHQVQPLHIGLFQRSSTNHESLTHFSTLNHLSLTRSSSISHWNVTQRQGTESLTRTQTHTTATVHTSLTHTPGRLTTNMQTVTTHEAHTTPGHGPTVTNKQFETKTITPVPPKLELQKKTTTTMTTRMDSTCGHCHHPNTQGGTTPLPLVARPFIPGQQMSRQPGTPLVFGMRQPTLPGIVPQLVYQGQRWPGQMPIGPGLTLPGAALVPNQGLLLPGPGMNNGGLTPSLPSQFTLPETPSLFEGKSVWTPPSATSATTAPDAPALTMPPPLLRTSERASEAREISTAVTPEEEATIDDTEALLPPPDLARLTEAIWEPADLLGRARAEEEPTGDDAEESLHLEAPALTALPR